MIPTPAQILGYIAPISEYLASNDVANGSLFGEPVNAMLPIQLYIETQSVQYRYDYEDIAGGNTPSQSLLSTANYLYGLCGKYGLIATALFDAGGIIPSTGGGTTIYGYPISGYYYGTFDGETDLTLLDSNGDLLPQGAKVVQVIKAFNPLEYFYWVWDQPVLALLDGQQLSLDEKLSFLYVVPI